MAQTTDNAYTVVGVQIAPNLRMNKIYIAAALAGAKVTKEHIGLDVQSFERGHPIGRSPSMKTEKGWLHESGAILRYIARRFPAAQLYGSDDFEASTIDMWVDFATTEMDPPAVHFLFVGLGAAPRTDAGIAEATSTISGPLAGVERALAGAKPYLVGSRLSIGDLAVFVSVDTYLRFGETAAVEIKKYPALIKWYTKVLQTERVQEALKAAGHDGTVPASLGSS